MARSIKKGPFTDDHLTKKVAPASRQAERPQGHQDLVALLDGSSRTSSA